MKKYKQLDLEQRYRIETLLAEGFNQSEIAERIGVHRSTVSRELGRNWIRKGAYDAKIAHEKYWLRERNKPRHRTFTYDMLKYIRKKLRDDRWSPEIISVIGRREFGTFVSHEWIYQYIWTAKHSKASEYAEDKDLHRYLRHHGRRQKRRSSKQNRGCIPNRIGIEHRPHIVEKRKRIGDLEVDLMMSTNHKPGLIILADRTTRLIKLIKVKTKAARYISSRIIRRMKSEEKWIKTMTFDNDLSFAQHELIATTLDVDNYFTRPYTSQDKGTVENRIGVLRMFFPKGTNLQNIHPSTLRAIEQKINNRPLRLFNYLTPIQKHHALVAVDT